MTTTINQSFKRAGMQTLRRTAGRAAVLLSAFALSGCSTLLVCNNDYSNCNLALGVPTDSPAAKILAPDGAVTTVDKKTGAMVTTRDPAFYRQHNDCIIGSGDNNPGCYSREPRPQMYDTYKSNPVTLTYSDGFRPAEFIVGNQNILTSTDGFSYRLPTAHAGGKPFNLNLLQMHCPKGTQLAYQTEALQRGNDPTRSVVCANLPPPGAVP